MSTPVRVVESIPKDGNIHQAYVFALDPTPEQAKLLVRHIGGSRFCYNALLAIIKADEGNLDTSHFDLLYLWAEQRDQLAPWWKENGFSSYNDATQRLSSALTNWQRGLADFPTFKRRIQGGSVRFTNQAIRLADSHHVHISCIGEIKTYESTRKLYRHVERGTGRILAGTVKRSADRWTVSFSVEVSCKVSEVRAPNRVTGVDVGLATLYTGATPDGGLELSVANPRLLVGAEHKLAHVQRITSRRQGPKRGVAPSNRWLRANGRVQKVHASVANARKNLIHETTTQLAKNYDVIVIENLNIVGLLKNRVLAKHISDASWGEFTRQLKYKTTWYGSTLIQADRFYPSSKTCASCGSVKAKLPLSERTYACDICGKKVDRDLNAATNLARQGLAGTNSVTGRGGMARPEDQMLDTKAQPCEASTETPLEVGV